MKTFRRYFCLLMFIFLLPRCAWKDYKSCEKVEQDKIYQKFEIKYSAQTEQNTISALFAEGSVSGEVISLKGQCSISHNGKPMQRQKVQYGKEVFYRDGFSAEYYAYGQILKNRFVFVDASGKVFESVFDEIPSVELKSLPETIKKSEDVRLSWTGSPYEEGDKVCLTITGDAAQLEDTLQKVCNQGNQQEMTLKSEKLLKLFSKQKVFLSLTRESTRKLNHATSAGGQVVFLFKSEGKKSLLKD